MAEGDELSFGSLELVDLKLGDLFVEFEVAVDFHQLILPQLQFLNIFFEPIHILLVLLGQFNHPLLLPVFYLVELLQTLHLHTVQVLAQLLYRHLAEVLIVLRQPLLIRGNQVRILQLVVRPEQFLLHFLHVILQVQRLRSQRLQLHVLLQNPPLQTPVLVQQLPSLQILLLDHPLQPALHLLPHHRLYLVHVRLLLYLLKLKKLLVSLLLQPL